MLRLKFRLPAPAPLGDAITRPPAATMSSAPLERRLFFTYPYPDTESVPKGTLARNLAEGRSELEARAMPDRTGRAGGASLAAGVVSALIGSDELVATVSPEVGTLDVQSDHAKYQTRIGPKWAGFDLSSPASD